MPLQYVNIKDSKVNFVSKEKDPKVKLSEFEGNLGNIILDSAMDKIKSDELESMQAEMLMEIALLKMGGAA